MNACCGCRCRLVPRCAKRPSARARKSSMRLSQACLASSLAPERNSEAMASACARGLRRLARPRGSGLCAVRRRRKMFPSIDHAKKDRALSTRLSKINSRCLASVGHAARWDRAHVAEPPLNGDFTVAYSDD